MVSLLIVMTNSYWQNIYILEQDWVVLFLGGNGVVDVIEEILIVLVIENTISLSKLRGIAYEIHVLSSNFVTRLHVRLSSILVASFTGLEKLK